MGKLSSQNRSSTQVVKENLQHTEKANIIKVLEKEIQEVYSSAKLKLFQQLFYLPRSEVRKMLAPEDESLFIIWAKNKSFATGAATIFENTSVHSELLEEDSILNANSAPPHSNGRGSAKVFENTSQLSRQPELLQNFVSNIRSVPPTNMIQEYSKCSAEGTENIPGNKTALSKLPELPQEDPVSDVGSAPPEELVMTKEHLQPSLQTSPSTLSPSVQGPSTSEFSFTLFNNDKRPVAQGYSCSVVPSKAPSQDFFAASTSNHNALNSFLNSTPQKTSSSVIMPIGIEVPSPFKRALLWPEPDNKKRRTKEQFPSAITGEAWRAIMTKKEVEKKQKEEEKERRKQVRLEKKIQKQKMIEEKKNTKKHNSKPQSKSKQKKKNQMPISSTDDSISDIDYGDSEYDVEDDLEKEEDYELNLRQLTASKENIKKDIRKRNVSESESEENNLPLKEIVKKKPKRDNYVIINYEGEYFPGVVKNIDGKQYEISTMTLSKGNSFRWPENPDQIWYNQEAIVENIENPILINKRGFYKVKEMEKYLTFVSR